MLCFNEGANQYFIASDDQVKIVESQMNDVLKRMISEGNEIITLSDVMDALGISADQKDDNDRKKGEIAMERSKMECITKKEFCEATHSNPNGWLFEHEKECPIEFYKEETDEGPIYHTYQGAEHRKFKDMPKYKEIWHCMADDAPFWGLNMWSIWTSY